MSDRNRKLLFVVILPVLTVLATVGPLMVPGGDLPDPMAVGWDGSGLPRSSASIATFLTIQAVSAAISALLFIVAGLARWRTKIYAGVAAVIAGATAPTFALTSFATVAANRNAPEWTAVDGPSVWWMVATMAASLLGVVAIGWLVRDLFRTPTPPVDTQPSAGLSISESATAAWYSGASSRWPFFVAGPMVAIGVALIGNSLFGVSGSSDLDGAAGLASGLLLVFIALLALAFATIGVTVDRRGMTISYGALPWPRTTVGLETIDTAHVVDVRPMEHGGWGYRGSRKMFGKAAVVIRGGEGIRLGLKDGNEFVVTVDNASQGAGVLNDLRAATT